jgi:hypothetical protein
VCSSDLSVATPIGAAGSAFYKSCGEVRHIVGLTCGVFVKKTRLFKTLKILQSWW